MEQGKQKELVGWLKEWAKQTMEAKKLEVEAVKRFILNNQKFDVFYDGDDEKNEARGRQGMMFIQIENYAPVLYVNWDEVNAFDDQQALFERLFEGEFNSDKIIKIRGVRL